MRVPDSRVRLSSNTGSGRSQSAVSPSSDMEYTAPMSAQLALRPLGQSSADLTVEAVALPVLHGNVAREGVEQVDVTLSVLNVPDLIRLVGDNGLPEQLCE